MVEKIKDKKWFKFLKNKYVITTIVFLVFFFFLDNNGLKTAYSLKKNNTMLKEQKAQLEESIAIDSANYVKMKTDPAEIERFGRENYYMKRDNEEIFIVKRDK